MSKNTFDQLFVSARTVLMLRLPFYGGLFCHLRVIVTRDVPTACVSIDDRLFINPDFFCGLATDRQRVFLLAHECLHPALGYFARATHMHGELANCAHDFVINGILDQEWTDWLIPSALRDKKYDGMTFEEVYAALVSEAKEGAGQPSSGGPGRDCITIAEADQIEGTDAPSPHRLDLGYREQQHRRWQQRAMRAIMAARAQGRGSAGLDRIAQLWGTPTAPWQEYLRLAVNDANVRVRSDWNHPSRRSAAVGVYMPHEQWLGFDVACYVDTSGSISKENLESAVREGSGIIEQCGGSLRWLEGDDGVCKDEWIDCMPKTLVGGGGTSFVPLFEHLAANPPKALVIFTDTFGTMPDFTPDYPVIWAIFVKRAIEIHSREVPFGEKIAIPESAFANTEPALLPASA